jgi:hypothetical protein
MQSMQNVNVVKLDQIITIPIELVMVVIIVAISIFSLYQVLVQWDMHKIDKSTTTISHLVNLWTPSFFGYSLSHHSFYVKDLYGDIMEFKLGSIRTLVISSPKMAKVVLKTHVLAFAYRFKSTISQFSSYGG